MSLFFLSTACSTVLVPARVMQALNLNLEDICSQPHVQPMGGGRLNSENGKITSSVINYYEHNPPQLPQIDRIISVFVTVIA